MPYHPRPERRWGGGRDDQNLCGKPDLPASHQHSPASSGAKKSALTEWFFPEPPCPEKLVSPGSAYRRLKDLLEEAGLSNPRFHDLRHTFATHALASGVNTKTLSGILGHIKASFPLDTYTHVTGDMPRNATEIVGGFMTELLGEEMEP